MLTFAIKQKRTPSIAPKRHAPTVSPMSHSLHLQQAKVRHILRGPTLQPKLTIGQPNNKYEQEAGRVADEVMRMPEPRVQRQVEPEEEEEETLQPKPLVSQITPLDQVQRQKELEEEEEEIQTKPLAEEITPFVQRQVEPEEEEEDKEIQPKSLAGAAPEVTPEMGRDIQSIKGAGQPLSASERAFFEPRFGADFGNVRVHSDALAAHVARSVNARAFTFGLDVVFGAGQYSPGTSSGRKLLAHELTHVVQQNDGAIVRQKRGRTPLPASIGRAPLINYHDSSTQHVIRMKPSNRSLSVPQWNQLPELARRELETKNYTKNWFSNKNDIRRLTVFNIYVKLKGLNLWKYVTSESSSGHGTLEFTTDNVHELKKTLREKNDFSNPEKSFSKWSSREKRDRGSLHFKHFSGWPKKKVQAHIDKTGLSGGIPIPIIGPIIQAIRHLIDWASDGYQDVYGIRDILLGQGWWRQPLMVQPKARRLSKSNTIQPKSTLNNPYYISFVHDASPAKPEHSLSNPGPPKPGVKRAGYTSVILKPRMTIAWDDLPSVQEGGVTKVPIYIQGASIYFMLQPIKVYVSSDYAVGSCPYGVTFRHEDSHARAFINIFLKHRATMVAKANTINLPTMKSPDTVPHTDITKTQAKYEKPLVLAVKRVQRIIRTEMQADRHAKDTPAAYQKDYAKCPASDW